MRIGVRGHDYGQHPPQELARRIKEAGFEALQLAPNKAISGMTGASGEYSPGACYAMRTAFEQQGLEVAVIGCYIEPTLPDANARAQQLQRFCENIAYCRQMGSFIVATETTMFTGDESDRPRAFDILTDSVCRMVEQAERFGVFVGIEPVHVHTLNSPERTYELLRRVRSNNLQIVFDPINLLTPQIIEQQDAVLKRCFDAFGERIVAIHAKDVIIENGAFRPIVIGEGLFDYHALLPWLHKHKPGITLLREEADPATAHKDIANLRRFIEETRPGT